MNNQEGNPATSWTPPRSHRRFVSLLFFLVVAAACSNDSKHLEERFERLSNSIKELDNKTERAEARLSARIDDESIRQVQLNCSEPNGFARVESNNGTFYIGCEDVQPFLDGFKLILRIGNPYFAAYGAAALHLSWWSGLPSARHSVQVTLTGKLRPGIWNRVEVRLTPATNDDLKSTFVSLEVNQVSLRRN